MESKICPIMSRPTKEDDNKGWVECIGMNCRAYIEEKKNLYGNTITPGYCTLLDK